MKMKKILGAICVALALSSCSTTSISGRKQLLLVSETDLVNQSYAQYRQFIASATVLNNKDAQMVKKVGNNIANAVERYYAQHPEQRRSNLKYQWEFNLVSDKTPNAWCMPGGKVAVYTGILPYTQNEQGLAVVMSHEIAHAIAQHGREQASHSLLQNLGGNIIGSMGYQTGAYGSISNLVMLKYSRSHETEADQLGLVFMKLAGYNPEYATTFWERMKKSSGGNAQPEFLSTHPSDERRIQDIKTFLNSEFFKNIK